MLAPGAPFLARSVREKWELKLPAQPHALRSVKGHDFSRAVKDRKRFRHRQPAGPNKKHFARSLLPLQSLRLPVKPSPNSCHAERSLGWNLVVRKLAERPEDWLWSSFRHYFTQTEWFEIESQWTARRREKLGIIPTARVRESPAQAKLERGTLKSKLGG
jgi:hypothetical protein